MLKKRITGYKQYTTSAGDTFDRLALNMYGDETKASEIIDFNPDYAKMVVFGAGVRLRIPIIEDNSATETLPPWRQ